MSLPLKDSLTEPPVPEHVQALADEKRKNTRR
jgi:hypothetical protein